MSREHVSFTARAALSRAASSLAALSKFVLARVALVRVALSRATALARAAGRTFAGRRLGARGAWVVAISGLAGLTVGAVSSTVYASTSIAGASGPSPSPDWAATIPPIVAAGGEFTTTVETVEVPLEPESITQSDEYLPVGYTKVISRGDPGLQIATYSVTWVDGVETDRQLLAAFVLEEPTHDVVSVGSLVVPSRGPVVPGSNRDIGKQLAASWGWTGVEWLCLDILFERESNWRTDADNPSSSAYGIPQALPGSKMASAGADWLTNPATQITWGLGYIEGRYGTPCGAWAAFSKRSPHWY